MASETTGPSLTWHRVLESEELPEGRVKTVGIGHHELAE